MADENFRADHEVEDSENLSRAKSDPSQVHIEAVDAEISENEIQFVTVVDKGLEHSSDDNENYRPRDFS